MKEKNIDTLMSIYARLSQKGRAVEKAETPEERQEALEDGEYWIKQSKQMINLVNAVKDWEKSAAKFKNLESSRMEYLIGDIEDANQVG